MSFIDYIEIGCGVAVVLFFVYVAFTMGWFNKD